MSIKKHLSFLELLYKKKEKIPIDFLIDEIDVDSYSFHNFLDVFIVQNRVIRLSKGLFRETYSIKEFTFDPHIAYQSFKLTALQEVSHQWQLRESSSDRIQILI